ncbi:hypothetical protein ABFS83_08G228000 [Erythranthe nasuta]
MGREKEQDQEQKQQQQQPKSSFRSKAAHLVSDITTVLLNPISDKPSRTPPPPPSSHDELNNSEDSHSDAEDDRKDAVEGPDTSSFTAFLYSLLASESNIDRRTDAREDEFKTSSTATKEDEKKKSLMSRGKQSIRKAFNQAAKIGGLRNQAPTRGGSDMPAGNGSGDHGIAMITLSEPLSSSQNLSLHLPETSEPSLLLSEKTRNFLYAALPVVVQGRKWVLLYSTWRHGISLSTLYRRSLIWPGLSLLVVGDRNGAVFGGLVEAPLRPTNKRRYQGTNDSFVFTDTSTQPQLFRPTGVNRYYTLCSTEYLAMGGGSHFALYLDGDLLSGSSSSSETYDNPCLAHSEDFEVKEVELWGFVYGSKYEETIALSRTEVPGICHW